jgi:hypothetical protein
MVEEIGIAGKKSGREIERGILDMTKRTQVM